MEAPEVISCPTLVNPLRKKQTTRWVIHPEQRFKFAHDVEASGSGSATVLPSYIPPRRDDAPNITIHKNSKYHLVKPVIPPGVYVTIDIMPNLKKLTFTNRNLRKFPELWISQYMTSVQVPYLVSPYGLGT